ncbi:MAG: hypothetical protein PHP03_03555 [Candidatus Pacebacteria bacterium]|nr:hypothetical protein [Candidatus Paceibacterota bacterium]
MDNIVLKNKILKARILAKIYFVWFLRRIVPLIIIQVAAIVVALKIFAKNVFFSKYLQNMANVSDFGLWATFKFLVNSFLQTNFLVQVIVLLVLGFGALLLRDVLKAILVYFQTLKQKNGE